MSLSIEEVRRIASLARLALSPEEEEVYAGQLARIVGYIDQLKSFETVAESQPTTPSEEMADTVGVGSSLQVDQDSFLRNCPEALDTFLVVPQVKA